MSPRTRRNSIGLQPEPIEPEPLLSQNKVAGALLRPFDCHHQARVL